MADLPNLIQLNQILSTKGGRVLAIALRQNAAQQVQQIAPMLQSTGIFVIHDIDGSAATQFEHPEIVPYGILVDADGRIDRQYAGPIDLPDILDRISK